MNWVPAESGDVDQRQRLRSLIDVARRQTTSAHRAPHPPGEASQPGDGATSGPIGNDDALPHWPALPGYHILREIHRGGQGVVFEAIQALTRRHVAVKVLREGPLGGLPDFLRFQREVQLLAHVNHPNIVAIHDSGQAAGHFFLVMDYIGGEPLDQYVRNAALSTSARRDRAPLLRLFATICDAVNAAHLKGVIHRDLKPGNIRVDDDGVPHVLDFGLAKRTIASDSESAAAPGAIHSMTETGRFLGSLPWASPEQAVGDAARIDVRTDVYSLGVILYEVLTQTFPYRVTGSFSDVVGQITSAQPIRPRLSSRDIDDELETIVLKCLQKDPTRRYQTAGDVARDIRHYLAGEPIEAKRDSAYYVLRKMIRRYRGAIAVMLAFILLISGSSVVAWSLMLRARRSERRSQENLRSSLLAQAQARRQTVTQGRRTDALDALVRAAAIRPGVDIRGEVISTLAVPDVNRRVVAMPAGSGAVALADDFSCCAAAAVSSCVSMLRLPDGVEFARIPAARDATAQMKWWCNPHRFVRLFDREKQPRRLEVWRVPEAESLVAISDVPERASFDVSPDGRTLAVGRTDRAIHLYNVDTGAETRRIELDRDPSYLRFDPSGHKLARFHARDEEASILDLDTGTSARILPSTRVSFSLAWSDDGRFIAAAQDERIHLWDVLAHREVAVLPGHETIVIQLVFSHDGRLLASCGWDESIVWDLTTLRAVLRPGLGAPLAISRDDRTIAGVAAAAHGPGVGLFELLHRDAYTLIGAEGGMAASTGTSGALHPGGRLAVAGFIDRTGNANGLRFFDVASQRVIGQIVVGRVESMHFDRSGERLFTCGAAGLLKWPVRLNEAMVHLGPPEQLLADPQTEHFDLSADAKRAAILVWAKGLLSVMDLDRPDQSRSFKVLPGAQFVSISPNGKWAAVSTWNGVGAEVWDLDAGAVIARPDSPGAAWPAFSPDGRWLVFRQWTRLTYMHAGVWDVHQIEVPGLARPHFTADGRLLVLAPVDNSSTIRLFDTAAFEELAAFTPPEPFTSCGVATSPAGNMLAVFTSRGAMLQLWDLHAIRSSLAAMKLDWDHPVPPPLTDQAGPPLRFEAESSLSAPRG